MRQGKDGSKERVEICIKFINPRESRTVACTIHSYPRPLDQKRSRLESRENE